MVDLNWDVYAHLLWICGSFFDEPIEPIRVSVLTKRNLRIPCIFRRLCVDGKEIRAKCGHRNETGLWSDTRELGFMILLIKQERFLSEPEILI
jgi:hypothetical protein